MADSSEAKKDRTEYYQFYYQNRKEELSKRRQERYQNDAAYREKAKRAARAYRKKKRKERERLRREGKLPPAQRGGPRKPVVVEINGKSFPAYTITTMAKRLNRAADTLNHWVKAGLLPKTPLRSGRGDRLYTDGMILVVQMALTKRGMVSTKDESFCREIVEGWSDLGIPAC